MVTRNMQFPDELYEKLKEIAAKHGLSVAAIIKIACNEYVERQGK